MRVATFFRGFFFDPYLNPLCEDKVRYLTLMSRLEIISKIRDSLRCLKLCAFYWEATTSENNAIVEKSMARLWEYGEKGDLDAFTLYYLACLIDSKPWYAPESSIKALELLAECNNQLAQLYLGEYLMCGCKGVNADPIMGRYWLERAESWNAK